MAFTRKFLAAQGIEADKVEAIMAAHVEVVDYHKEQYAELKEKFSDLNQQAAKVTELENKLSEANNKLSESEKKIELLEKDDYKGKYESEKAAKQKLESEIATKETSAKKDKAFTKLLAEKQYSEEAAKLIVKKGGYSNKIELDENGIITNADSILNDVQNDFSMFTPKISSQSSTAANPPANSSGKALLTKADIMKIKDTAARQKAIAENRELFNP